MASSIGPDIIESGLVLHLDAANPRSYPGTGTGWFDISGRSNNATMFGSVPYTIDTVSCFDFSTGTGDFSYTSSLGFTFLTDMVPRSGNFTFSCWVKNPNPTPSAVGLFSNTGYIDGYRFGVHQSGAYYLISGANFANYTEGGINFLASLSTDSWHNIVMVFNRNGLKMNLYRNGVFQGDANLPAIQDTMSGNNIPGIVRSGCCSRYTGKLASFSVYNYGLNVSEIQQNFVALRGRFGV